MKNCVSCPRNCSVDRTKGKGGFCLSGALPVISSYTPHFGEEPVISGQNGAGNIFFGNCNLRCVFCQNFEISQSWKTENQFEIPINKLAEIMLELQRKKCHNIGLVSPTHFSPQIIQALFIAVKKGLNIPIVYNSNGYDSVDMLRYFEDVADIYLPDFKWGDSLNGKEFSKADNYFNTAKLAVKEMYRQVGSSVIIENGVMKRGLIIRHLVMPNELAETEKVFDFIACELGNEVHVSVMAQYYPTHKAEKYPLISRKISEREYEKVIELIDKYELHNGFVQELESSENYQPDFKNKRENPFNN